MIKLRKFSLQTCSTQMPDRLVPVLVPESFKEALSEWAGGKQAVLHSSLKHSKVKT
jgi:hypothetical protein